MGSTGQPGSRSPLRRAGREPRLTALGRCSGGVLPPAPSQRLHQQDAGGARLGSLVCCEKCRSCPPSSGEFCSVRAPPGRDQCRSHLPESKITTRPMDVKPSLGMMAASRISTFILSEKLEKAKEFTAASSDSPFPGFTDRRLVQRCWAKRHSRRDQSGPELPDGDGALAA